MDIFQSMNVLFLFRRIRLFTFDTNICLRLSDFSDRYRNFFRNHCEFYNSENCSAKMPSDFTDLMYLTYT